MKMRNRLVVLVRRPVGTPALGDFAICPSEIEPPGPGELLIRNRLMSVDPYQRSRMNLSMIHSEPFTVGAPLDGAALGEVLDSQSDAVRTGELVVHGLGWREYATVPAASVRVVTPEISATAQLSVLGMTGMTAWVGLRTIAEVASGDSLLVSTAAGAVGTAVVSLAAAWGLTVVGLTGSSAKADWLRNHTPIDHAVVYREPKLADRLRTLLSDPADVYFDGAGGRSLEAALEVLRVGGRVVACGMMAEVNGESEPVRNLAVIVGKRLTVQGFVVSDHYDDRTAFEREVLPMIMDGRVRPLTTVRQGLDAAPNAFCDMLAGRTVGKTLVELA